jgi:hypothetical protein
MYLYKCQRKQNTSLILYLMKLYLNLKQILTKNWILPQILHSYHKLSYLKQQFYFYLKQQFYFYLTS